MYAKYKRIGGVLHLQSIPGGEFRPMTPMQLTDRIVALEAELRAALSKGE